MSSASTLAVLGRDAVMFSARGDRAAANRLLMVALSVSIFVHAVVLAIRFTFPNLELKPSTAPPLEVVLVNARTTTKPPKAEVLAQANLDGGGNTDAKRRAKTPLPVIQHESTRIELEQATQRIEALEQRAQELIAAAKAMPLAPPPPIEPKLVEPQPEEIDARDLMRRTMEAMRLEAQIARDMEAYQQRPRRRFIGARAEEYRFARYVEDWRMKIERVGNLNYPDAAREAKIHGSLLITVSIRADGTVENVEINRSSGKKVLDAAAMRILELAAPYAPFPPDIRRDTDVLHITRTWTFAPGDNLVSN